MGRKDQCFAIWEQAGSNPIYRYRHAEGREGGGERKSVLFSRKAHDILVGRLSGVAKHWLAATHSDPRTSGTIGARHAGWTRLDPNEEHLWPNANVASIGR